MTLASDFPQERSSSFVFGSFSFNVKICIFVSEQNMELVHTAVNIKKKSHVKSQNTFLGKMLLLSLKQPLSSVPSAISLEAAVVGAFGENT